MRELVLIVVIFALGLYVGFMLPFTAESSYETLFNLVVAAGSAAIGFFVALLVGWWYLRRVLTRAARGRLGVVATADALHAAVFNFLENKGSTLKDDSGHVINRGAATYAHLVSARFLIAAATAIIITVTGAFGSLMLLRQIQLLSEQNKKITEQTEVFSKQTDLLEKQLESGKMQARVAVEEFAIRRRDEVTAIEKAAAEFQESTNPRARLTWANCHPWAVPQEGTGEQSPDALARLAKLTTLVRSTIDIPDVVDLQHRKGQMGRVLDILVRQGVWVGLLGGVAFDEADPGNQVYNKQVLAGVSGEHIDLKDASLIEACIIGSIFKRGLNAPGVNFSGSRILGSYVGGHGVLRNAKFRGATVSSMSQFHTLNAMDMGAPAGQLVDRVKRIDMKDPKRNIDLLVKMNAHHPLAYLLGEWRLGIVAGDLAAKSLVRGPEVDKIYLRILHALNKRVTELGADNDYLAFLSAVFYSNVKSDCLIKLADAADRDLAEVIMLKSSSCPNWELHVAVASIKEAIRNDEVVIKISYAKDPIPYFSRASRVSSEFVDSDMSSTEWLWSVLVDVSFDRSNLQDASFLDAVLLGRTSFKGADLSRSDLRIALPKELRGLARADFSGAKLDGAAVDGVDFGENRSLGENPSEAEMALRAACVCGERMPWLHGKEIRLERCSSNRHCEWRPDDLRGEAKVRGVVVQ